MNPIKPIVSVLIFLSIFMSICNYALATPSYVSVKEGDAYIWENTYNKNVMEDYLEDLFDNYDKIYDFGNGDIDFDEAINISEGLYKGQSLIYEDDVDWFKINVVEDKNLTIQANYTGISYSLDLEVFNEEEDEIGYESSSSKVDKIVIHTKYTGYYYVSVELWEEGPLIYDIQVNITDWIPDYYEPNNNFFDAPYIGDDCYYDDDLECSYGNEDYFEIEIEEYIPVTISIDFNNTEGDLNLYLYNKTYDLVSYSNSTIADREQISYTPSSLDYYYVMINNSDSSSIYNNHTYTLSLFLDSDCFSDDDGDYDVEDMVEDITEIQGNKLTVLDVKDEKNDLVKVRTREYDSKNINDDDKWKHPYIEIFELYNPKTDKCYKKLYLGEIIPKGIDWDKVANELKEDLDDIYKKCDIKITVNWLKNGITTHFDFDISDMKDWETYIEYDENGVKALEISKYSNKEFRRETLKGYMPPFNIRVIAIGATIIGIIAVVTIVIIRKRR